MGLFLEENPLHLPSFTNPLKIPNPVGAGEAAVSAGKTVVEDAEAPGKIPGQVASAAVGGITSSVKSIVSGYGARLLELITGVGLIIFGLVTLAKGSAPSAAKAAAAVVK